MQILKDRIMKEGKVLPGNILKVDGFLNQMIDTALLRQMGEEFARLFSDAAPDKVLTVESSGISIACAAAQALGDIPAVFAKKHETLNQDPDSYSTSVYSYILDHQRSPCHIYYVLVPENLFSPSITTFNLL